MHLCFSPVPMGVQAAAGQPAGSPAWCRYAGCSYSGGRSATLASAIRAPAVQAVQNGQFPGFGRSVRNWFWGVPTGTMYVTTASAVLLVSFLTMWM